MHDNVSREVLHSKMSPRECCGGHRQGVRNYNDVGRIPTECFVPGIFGFNSPFF
jgi:hypothetical protein